MKYSNCCTEPDSFVSEDGPMWSTLGMCPRCKEYCEWENEMNFNDFFGFNPFEYTDKNRDNLSALDRQQAEEATKNSGLTDPNMQKLFYRTFLKERAARNMRI